MTDDTQAPIVSVSLRAGTTGVIAIVLRKDSPHEEHPFESYDSLVAYLKAEGFGPVQ